jgi:hypothetical protein
MCGMRMVGSARVRCATPGYDARSADGWFKSENGASHLPGLTGGLLVMYDL